MHMLRRWLGDADFTRFARLLKNINTAEAAHEKRRIHSHGNTSPVGKVSG